MLIKFFVSAANNGYLNGLANEFNESTNSIRKELNNLSSAGYLLKSKENNRVIKGWGFLRLGLENEKNEKKALILELVRILERKS